MLRRNVSLLIVALSASATLSACGSSTSSGASGKSFCEIAKAADGDKQLANMFNAGSTPTKDDLAKATKLYEDLATAAPAEIKTEMSSARDFVRDDMPKLLDFIEKAKTDPTKMADAAKEVQPLVTKMEGLSAKMDKVSTYAKEKCGVKL
jgi:hypothetical protein